MRGRRAAGCAALCAVLGGLLLGGCGRGGDATPGALGGPPDAGAPTSSAPAPHPTPRPTGTVAPADLGADDLQGLWGAGEDGGEIVYEFDPDGTFTRVSLLREEREGGTFRFQDVVEGTYRVQDGRLRLRPTAGTQTVDDPDADRSGPVSTRKTDLAREVHTVELRQDRQVLVLTPDGGGPVTLARQHG